MIQIIIHIMYKYRNIEPRLEECLRTFRVVSLTGARQVGKTTLVRRLADTFGLAYTTFDNPVTRALATEDPEGWLAAQSAPLAIDEVQFVPGIFPAIKRRVDSKNQPGQFLLTGSALWLSMRSIGESLAGRTAILELLPFRASEWKGTRWKWGDLLCGADPTQRPHTLPSPRVGMEAVWEAVFRGGYPEAAGLQTARSRQTWHESYLRTYLQRDVLDLMRLEKVAEFTRLIRLLASQTSGLANQSDLGRDIGLPQPTVRRYLDWLRITYQCHALPPFSANLGKRLVKTPKLHWGDSGMAAALAGVPDRARADRAQKLGALLETWVVQDLRAWAAEEGGITLSFYRDHDGGETDVIIEMEDRVHAIEIKARHRINRRDLKGLRICRDGLGKKFGLGIVLYGGETAQVLEDRLLALPLACLLGT